MYTWNVTKVEKSTMWLVELDNGIIKRCSNKRPPYKVGDIIVSLPHFQYYMDIIDRLK